MIIHTLDEELVEVGVIELCANGCYRRKRSDRTGKTDEETGRSQ